MFGTGGITGLWLLLHAHLLLQGSVAGQGTILRFKHCFSFVTRTTSAATTCDV